MVSVRNQQALATAAPKIIPALDAFPTAFICTADDDTYYQSSWLEELTNGVSIKDKIITCHRANKILRDPQGVFRPYKDWPLSLNNREASKDLFPTGVGGVLYPPGVLLHTTEDRQKILDLCPYADDIWLYWIGRRNDASYKMTRKSFKLISWDGSQNTALWRGNVIQNGNDVQIRMMAERYGYPGLT